MQGVEISGMIVWSVYRNDDGPLQCYKSFGEDLQRATPSEANKKIESLAISIVRESIANMTISDILKNRSKLRDNARQEMQKQLKGWGMWLETCEIMDVKISSGSLFKHLQTKFREEKRIEAETIAAETENQIQTEKLTRDTKLNGARSDADKERQLHQDQVNLKIREAKSKTMQSTIEIDQKEAQARNNLRIKEKELAFDVKKKEMEFNNVYAKAQNEINIE